MIRRSAICVLFLVIGICQTRADDVSKAVEAALGRAAENKPQIQRALAEAPAEQQEAMRFLVTHMPERDLKELKAEFLYRLGTLPRSRRIAHVIAQCAKGLSPAHQEAWLAKTKAAGTWMVPTEALIENVVGPVSVDELKARPEIVKHASPDQIAAWTKTKEAIDEEIRTKLKTEREKIAEEEAKKARLLLASDLEQKDRTVADLQEVLKERDGKLAEAQKAQAELIRKQRELDDAKREMDLTIEKRVTESLEKTREQAKKEAK